MGRSVGVRVRVRVRVRVIGWTRLLEQEVEGLLARDEERQRLLEHTREARLGPMGEEVGALVVSDAAVLARAKNLVLGCRVSAVRSVRSIRKGGQDQLMQLGKEALVKWDEGALRDIEGEGQHERLISLASLIVVAAPGKVVEEKKAAAEAAVQLPAGEPWAKLTTEMIFKGSRSWPLVLCTSSMRTVRQSLTK